MDVIGVLITGWFTYMWIDWDSDWLTSLPPLSVWVVSGDDIDNIFDLKYEILCFVIDFIIYQFYCYDSFDKTMHWHTMREVDVQDKKFIR